MPHDLKWTAQLSLGQASLFLAAVRGRSWVKASMGLHLRRVLLRADMSLWMVKRSRYED